MENMSRSGTANPATRPSAFDEHSPTCKPEERRTRTAGSRRSRPDTLLLVALLALLALLTGACSTTTETSTAGNDFVQLTPPAEGFDSLADPGGDAGDAGTGSDGVGVTKQPATDDHDRKPDVRTPSSAVLAAALAGTDDGSYSFDVGMEMNMTMMGAQMTMAPQGPIMTGSVSGDRMYAVMDMGALMAGTTMTDEHGVPIPVPELAEVSDARFEMWFDGSVMTVDMSAMAGLDPSLTGAAASGPVSFDLTELEGLGMDDLTAEMFEGAGMFPGTQSMDPAATADLLRSIDGVVEVGTDDVDGRTVTVYQGSLSFAEYAEAMGEDIDAGFAEMDELGLLGDPAAMLSALDDLHVDMTIMIDDDDLLRRLEMFIDMGPVFQGMFSPEALAGGPLDESVDGEFDEDEFAAAMEAAIASMFADMTMTMNMWMEFDGYGEVVAIVPPPAVDLTHDAESVFGTSYFA
jgi:hypothetical protein